MKRFTTLAWYTCLSCGYEKHGSDFYLTSSGARTDSCVSCFDKATDERSNKIIDRFEKLTGLCKPIGANTFTEELWSDYLEELLTFVATEIMLYGTIREEGK